MPKNIKQYSIGVDIGGTKMSAVLFDGTKVIADYSLATPKDSLEHFLIMLKALVEPLLDKAKKQKIEVKGIGVGAPGILDRQQSMVLRTHNLHIIDGVKLGNLLEEKLKLPVKLGNDTDGFVRAEAKLGAAKGYNNVYGLTIGTGIGDGWWYNGEIYLGSHGGAGESSEMVISEAGLGLEAVYQKLSQNNPAQIAEEAYRGDVLAEKTYGEIGKYIGMALANIVNLIDPGIIVIGGAVANSSDLFLSQVKKTMKKHIFSPEAKKVKIVKSKLGPLAGAIGAALLV